MAHALMKHTLNLREGDFAYLDSVYGASGTPTSHVIRALVARHVETLREKENNPLPKVEINV